MHSEQIFPRMTRIEHDVREFRIEDIIVNEFCLITGSHNGLIKRTPANLYRSQKRGGKRIIGFGQRDEDFIEHMFTANTHDNVMFVMSNGRIYFEKVYEIPEGASISKGRALANVFEMQNLNELLRLSVSKSFQKINSW
jgi:DNA gyrase subunit A